MTGIMEFNKQTFNERKTASQTSEMYAMEYYKNRKIQIVRSGLDALDSGIPAKNWMNIPKYIRNLPDFIIVGDKGNFFLECKGGYSHINLRLVNLKVMGFGMILFLWLCLDGHRHITQYIE